MIGFLIKKTFFDLWDHLFVIALLNLGFIASASIPILLAPALSFNTALFMIVLFAGIVWCFIYAAAVTRCLMKFSDYSRFDFGDFLRSIKPAIPAGVSGGILVFFLFLLITMVIPFYLNFESILGILLSALIFWTLVIGVLSLQFFITIAARLDPRILKAFKKSFLIFFDNTGFCVFSFFHNLLLLVVSALTAFLIPGPAGILLYLDEALRLRLMKYDWLEAHPGEGRRIPWDALLIDERDKTGTRSLKNFIFPWKD
jgi:hypothetical protein